MSIRVINSRGFTLIELVVVILFLAITAGIAVPSFGKSIGRYKAQAAGFQAAEMLNAARERARATSATVYTRFDTARSIYMVDDRGDGRVREVSTQQEHGGVSIAWAIFIHKAGVSMSGIAFDHTGAPLSGDASLGETLAPLTSANIGFVLGDHTVQLTVDAITGFTEVVQ